MFNVCAGCGEYSVEKEIDPEGPAAACPRCGHRQPFRRLPLFLVTGASGAGKTAVALRLPALLPECVVLESDVLWGVVPATAVDGYRSYWNAWLRLVKNIAQGGRPVVLCGTTFPETLDQCPERRYIGDIHTLALVCNDEHLRSRLTARPGWRGSAEPESLRRMLAVNRRLRDAAAGRGVVETLHTDASSPDETASAVAAWVRGRLRAA